MNKDIDYGVFMVDDLDECSDMSQETVELNNKFENEVIVPKIEMMNDWQCPCCLGRAKSRKKFNPTGTVSVMDHKGEITDKAVEDVAIGEMVLEPIDNITAAKVEEINDRPDLFDYTAIVHSHDNEYKDLVCVIRHCTNCGDIKINGDLDAVTKIIGMGFMNNLDYETKCAEAEHPEEDGCESCGCDCEECSCHHCDDGEPDCAPEECDN